MSPGPFWRALFDFFFPPKCPLCGENQESPPGEGPCPTCLSRIKYFSSPRCPRCGISFVSPSESDHLCSECLTEERYFTKARAVCLYEGPIVEAISRFKYGRVTRLARPLGSFLVEYRDPEFPFSDLDLILPVLSTPDVFDNGGLTNPYFWLAISAVNTPSPWISPLSSGPDLPRPRPSSPAPSGKRMCGGLFR